jgi:hypothetical protein
MGTRALIGYLDTDGVTRLTSTYNNYDGYPSNLGKGLTKFYNNDAKAEEIANVGYISYLDPETGKWDAANKQNPRKNTLTDNFNEAMLDIASEIDSFGADYGYIWDNEKEEWMLIKNDGIRGMSKDLEIQLAHLKDKFAMMPERPDQTRSHFVDNDEADEDARMNEVTIKEENTISKAKKALQGKENFQAYIKSLTKDVELNGQDAYVDYTVDDWEEDYISNGFGSYSDKEMNEAFIRQMKYRAGILK